MTKRIYRGLKKKESLLKLYVTSNLKSLNKHKDIKYTRNLCNYRYIAEQTTYENCERD